MELIIDSGASCCILDKRCLPTSTFINNEHTLEISGVNGITSTLGSVDTFVGYKSVEYPIRFNIMERLPDTINGLIGTNFLNKFGAIIDFVNMKMELQQPYNDTYYMIPARTEIVKFVNTNVTETCVVLNQEIQPHVFIANAIVQPSNGKIPIRMVNVKNKPVQISNLQPIIKPASDYLVLNLEHKDNQTDRVEKLLEELDLSHLSRTEKQHIQQICTKFADIFCLEKDNLTVTNIYSPVIKINKEAQPIYCKPYKLPQKQQAEVEAQIQNMVDNHIIEKATSAWNSPILLVPKKSSGDSRKWRLVIDYRKLNKVIEDDKFPLPNIEDIIDTLAGAQYFSHLDLSQGYYQCSLRPEDRPVTAFSTPSGQYQMTRLPMGLKISPSTFSRLMTIAMSGLDMTKCLVYLDDIIVFGKTIEEHNKNLIAVFEKLRSVNLKLNPKKCNFFKTELLYLGHLISAEGVKPDPAKVEAVKNWPRPQNADEAKRFVAFANYYRKHIRNFASLCYPLNYLTRKNVPFVWDNECEKAFNTLREVFLKPPVLDFPDFSQSNTFNLHTDASGYAIGAVLSNKNGRPIAYASKMLNNAERNYPTIEKELLAIVWGIRHFRPYLYGRKFDVYTDHRPLMYLFSLTDPSSRLTKFRLALEEYDFEVIYKRGAENVIADALSRISSQDLKGITEKVNLVTTRSKTRSTNNETSAQNESRIDHPTTTETSHIEVVIDPQCNDIKLTPELITIPIFKNMSHLRGIMEKLKEFCEKSKKACLIIRKNNNHAHDLIVNIKSLKMRNIPKILILGEKIKEILNKEDKQMILNDYHILPTAGHAGIKRTLKTIKQKYFWKGMHKDITDFVKSCLKCQKYKATNKERTPSIVTTTADTAFEKIFMDLVGPLIPSEGHEYILTTQCELTKFVTATPIKDKSTETVAKAFVNSVILKYGVPNRIASDRGTEFMSELFAELAKLLEIKKLNSTAYHHEAIGALENTHKVLGNFLRIQCSNKIFNWSDWVPYYEFAFNNTVHSSTNYTPFYLLYGRNSRMPSSLTDTIPDPLYNLDDFTKLMKLKMQITHEEVKQKLIQEKIDRIKNTNTNTKPRFYKEGEYIWLKNETAKKLEEKFLGPYKILEDQHPNVKIQIKNRQDVVHKNRIKPHIGSVVDRIE